MSRRDRLAACLDRRELDSVWFAGPNSFAWATGGSNVVDRESGAGVAAVGFDGDWRVLTDTIEAERIATEELPDVDARVDRFPWYESTLPEALAERVDGPAGADIDVPGFARIDPGPLRQPLTDRDVDRYRDLGRETATAVESVCRELRPDDTEREVAAALTVALSARAIEAPVVLVGGSDRAGRYRHYTPTDDELGAYALVSVTAQRQGLHASCTRTVAFDAPPWLEERHAGAARVEATALAATQATAAGGGTAGDIFDAIRDAYAAEGHPDEWTNHHQGGAAGYAGREWIAAPDHAAPVETPMAYAWNPTIRGAKSEDTVLVTEDGFEVLTDTGRWPTRTVDARGYDSEIARPEPLSRTVSD